MPVLSKLLFAVLVLAPILLAWVKGDRILDFMDARRKKRRRQKRKKRTRSLPLREDAVRSILDAEDRCDEIDARIAGSLTSYQVLQNRDREGTVLHVLSEAEHMLLSRESHFNSYLDIAWLQSETIEILSEEVSLLRNMAQLGPHQHRPAAPAAATSHLIENLEAAIRKRADVDRMLDNVGNQSADNDTGSSFDATVG